MIAADITEKQAATKPNIVAAFFIASIDMKPRIPFRRKCVTELFILSI